MKLRNKEVKDIFIENDLKQAISSNLIEENDSKRRIRATLELLAKILSGTLGPYGSATLIQDMEGRHFSTKDGYDVMNKISFIDELSRTILDIVRNISSDQVLTVGDGSTSAVIVANSLYSKLTGEEFKSFFNKMSSKDINDMLTDIEIFLSDKLNEEAIPLSEDMRELDIIASIATNNDIETGKFIADIYKKIGSDGFINTDVNNTNHKDTIEFKKGIEWNRGYTDSVYVSGKTDKKVIYEKNPRVIIFNKNMTYDHLEPIVKPLLMEGLNQEEAELLIVTNNMDDDAKTFFAVNRKKHNIIVGKKSIEMRYTVVDMSQMSQQSINNMEDLATLVGSKVIDLNEITREEVENNLSSYIGSAGKIIVTEKSTQVIGKDEEFMSEKHREVIEEKVSGLKSNLTELRETNVSEDSIQVYELKRRIANLTNATAIIKVGGRTTPERVSRERLIEDAILACKSTLKSNGYVVGGNIMIPKILTSNKETLVNQLKDKYFYIETGDDKEEYFGTFIEYIKDGFLESYRTVLNNSYLSEERVEEIIKICLDENKFYNLKLHKFENFNETSVINSVETDRNIARSCMSIIGALSTTNQVIVRNIDMNSSFFK